MRGGYFAAYAFYAQRAFGAPPLVPPREASPRGASPGGDGGGGDGGGGGGGGIGGDIALADALLACAEDGCITGGGSRGRSVDGFRGGTLAAALLGASVRPNEWPTVAAAAAAALATEQQQQQQQQEKEEVSGLKSGGALRAAQWALGAWWASTKAAARAEVALRLEAACGFGP